MLFLHAEKIKHHARVAVSEHVGDATRLVCPHRESNEVEHGLDLLVQIRSRSGTLEFREVGRGICGRAHRFEALLGLTQHGEIFIESLVVFPSRFSLESLGVFRNAIEQAGHLFPLPGITHRIRKRRSNINCGSLSRGIGSPF